MLKINTKIHLCAITITTVHLNLQQCYSSWGAHAFCPTRDCLEEGEMMFYIYAISCLIGSNRYAHATVMRWVIISRLSM